ncbi:hypothetical protein [Planomonospora parontospora]|uniref:hypothetical protein n=1 Tax=Planomonospora parontospora TaxID=58119 RepID=UPI00167072B4|nr:hypothetical protein [Planomonospora parontospora]GGL56633.1 hypothetical protein GCM10014719_67550 [Planomonospora parontospora subsp. antibiotica]GII19945.1 hypothetical protein Ppa05_66710 [Planomonospora parontospora subsp. antibiotica]
MGHKRPTFVERSDRGDCFSAGCSRRPTTMITFKGEMVWSCASHSSADGRF